MVLYSLQSIDFMSGELHSKYKDFVFNKWFDFIGDAVIVDAIGDRLLDISHKIDIEGY